MFTLITPPTAQPVTRAECKLNSRVTLDAERKFRLPPGMAAC